MVPTTFVVICALDVCPSCSYKWDTLPNTIRPEKGLLKIRSELNAFANLRPAIVPKQVSMPNKGWSSCALVAAHQGKCFGMHHICLLVISAPLASLLCNLYLLIIATPFVESASCMQPCIWLFMSPGAFIYVRCTPIFDET